MKKIYLILSGVIIVLVGLFFGLKGAQDKTGQSPSPSASPTASGTPGPSGTNQPVISVRPIKTPRPQSELPLINKLSGPATCRLQGQITFLTHNIYNNGDAKLIYVGIDHPARLIKWTVTPKDDLSVGPNLMNQLPLPNGETLLTISLPDNHKSKTYELTATMDYARVIESNVKLFTAQCAGKTTVVLP